MALSPSLMMTMVLSSFVVVQSSYDIVNPVSVGLGDSMKLHA